MRTHHIHDQNLPSSTRLNGSRNKHCSFVSRWLWLRQPQLAAWSAQAFTEAIRIQTRPRPSRHSPKAFARAVGASYSAGAGRSSSASRPTSPPPLLRLRPQHSQSLHSRSQSSQCHLSSKSPRRGTRLIGGRAHRATRIGSAPSRRPALKSLVQSQQLQRHATSYHAARKTTVAGQNYAEVCAPTRAHEQTHGP